MKRLLSLLLILILSGCEKESPHINTLSEITANYVEVMKTEYGLNQLLDHNNTEVKLKKINIDFTHFEESEILHARFLINRCAREILQRINSSPGLQDCFDHFPLTERDLEISIAFIDPKTHKRYNQKALALAHLVNGQVSYSTFQMENNKRHVLLKEDFIFKK